MSVPGLPDAVSSPTALLPAALSRAAGAVLPALQSAARRTGADFSALLHMAKVESGFNPAARASGSSARGLFQFVDSTWLDVLRRHGAEHGIPALPRQQALALRDDPAVASVMAASHMLDNAASLEATLGRKADTVDLYFAHFLGAAGAGRFLSALDAEPGALAAGLFPQAAAANRAIFYENGRPRTLQEVHSLVAGRLGLADGSLPDEGLAGRAAAAQRLPVSAPAPVAPAAAARLAYLMLADLGD